MFYKVKLALDIGFISYLFMNPEKFISIIAGVFGIIMYLIRCVFLVRDYVNNRKKNTYNLDDFNKFYKEIYGDEEDTNFHK